MCIAVRARIDGVAGNQASVARVRAQVMAQAVRNVRQVGQGQRVGRVVTCYGYLKGIDSVKTPRPALWCRWARVDNQPRRRDGRFAARPPRVRRRVAVQDDGNEGVGWLEFKFREVGIGVLAIEAPDDVGVLVSTERVGVNGFYA